ncbi:MAG: recombination protein O N-terminal domain-containing protein [Sphingopyxis sp.]
MHLVTTAIICAARPHGEHGAIARLMTEEAGLLAGYVQGGRSRRMRPIMMPANIVAATFRARTEEQLASLTIEMVHSRAPLMREPLAAAAIDWVTTLTGVALPEGHAYPALFAGLSGLLSAIELSPVASNWSGALVRYETLLLAELGYGDVLERTTDLSKALARNGKAINKHLLSGPRADNIADVRARLIARLERGFAPRFASSEMVHSPSNRSDGIA